jgi:ferredoxin
MSYIIGNKCVGVKDGICIEVCPIEDTIVEGPDSMYINPDTCIDCGACLPECPVDAIYDSEEEAIENNELDAVKQNYKFYGLTYNG